jgi:SAM-dependent methyltransferase
VIEISSIDAVNRSRYSRVVLSRAYARSEGLQVPEAVVLDRIAPDVRGLPVLDVGVGAGRTTPFLRALSHDYLGVDYSETMVTTCRRRFPEARFEVADARSLASFGPGAFGLVMFSFNGIDCVDHVDRLAILRNVHHILRPAGWFVFSSHNRDCPRHGFRPPAFYGSRRPDRLLLRAGAWLDALARAARNRRRLRRFECENSDYEIRNDEAHEHSLLTYYVRVSDQIRQLRDAGFDSEIVVHRLDGRLLRATEICGDPWIYYAARR